MTPVSEHFSINPYDMIKKSNEKKNHDEWDAVQRLQPNMLT